MDLNNTLRYLQRIVYDIISYFSDLSVLDIIYLLYAFSFWKLINLLFLNDIKAAE